MNPPRRLLRVAALILQATLAESVASQHIAGSLADPAAGSAVWGARVELLDRNGNAIAGSVSDSAGRFALNAPRAGRYRLRASALGYTTATSSPFDLQGGETVRVELSLAAQALSIDPLRVLARGRTSSLYLEQSGFYDRESRGVGSFLTRYEIERHGGGSFLSDVLRGVQGIRLMRADRSGRRYEIRLRNARCPPAVYLDGAIVRLGGPVRPSEVGLDDLVPAIDIDGIEIYHGPAETPPAFNREATCGVIVLWTRRRR